MLTDNDALVQTLMQWMSRCATPWQINSEIGDLSQDDFSGSAHFHYQRYDLVLDREWLKSNLGLDLPPEAILRLAHFDQPQVAQELLDLGRAAAKTKIKADHFPAVFDLPPANL